MGDRIQYDTIQRMKGTLQSPCLEVGSKWYAGMSFDYRPMFEQFVGTDLQPGENVDVVVDLMQDWSEIVRQFGDKLPEGGFKTIICASVLEHCRNPFLVAANLERLLAIGGKLYISAPFVFPIHGFPDDYFRYTPNGVKALFNQIEWDDSKSFYSSHDDVPEENRPLTDIGNYEISFGPKRYFKEKNYSRMLGAFTIKSFSAVSLKWLTRLKRVYPIVNVNMFGTKKA